MPRDFAISIRVTPLINCASTSASRQANAAGKFRSYKFRSVLFLFTGTPEFYGVADPLNSSVGIKRLCQEILCTVFERFNNRRCTIQGRHEEHRSLIASRIEFLHNLYARTTRH